MHVSTDSDSGASRLHRPGGWASKAIGAQRILGEVTGAEWSAKVTDTVLRASLPSP